MPNNAKIWSKERVRTEIRNVMGVLNIERMPTRSECVKVLGNSSLACAVPRVYGTWYKLAGDMGLDTKSSETTTGKHWEAVVAELLAEKGYKVERMTQNYPYDLLVNNFVKVDVKASHIYNGPNGGFYSFAINKPHATCDIYILVALDNNSAVERVMVVPSKFVHSNSQVSVGLTNSKYHKYTDAYRYIDTMSAFWEAV